MLIGLMGSSFVGNGMLSTAVVIAGVISVGIAHGFINAPVVTHVAHSELARQIGANSATTAYRFLERIGHVVGPVLVAQLFLIWGQSPQILAGIGIATAIWASSSSCTARRRAWSRRSGDGTMIDRIRARSVGIVAGLLLSILAASAPAQEKFASKWFRYGPGVDTAWTISADPAKPLRLSVQRKARASSASSKRVLVLYPRPSSAYDIAITKILQEFDAKDVDATVTVINFEMNDVRGTESIQFAENNKIDLIFAMGSDPPPGFSTTTAAARSRSCRCARKIRSNWGRSRITSAAAAPFCVHVAECPGRSADGLREGIAARPQESGRAGRQQECERGADPGGAHCVLCAPDRNSSHLGSGAESVEGARRAGPDRAERGPDHAQSDPDLSKSLFWMTGSTSVFLEIRTVNEHADRVPVVSVVPEIVKAGPDTAVLAIGVSFESNAHLAAIYGAQILAGRAKAGDLKVGLVSPPDIAISFMKAREIGLRIPFNFYESASFIYDYEGRPARTTASKVLPEKEN